MKRKNLRFALLLVVLVLSFCACKQEIYTAFYFHNSLPDTLSYSLYDSETLGFYRTIAPDKVYCFLPFESSVSYEGKRSFVLESQAVTGNPAYIPLILFQYKGQIYLEMDKQGHSVLNKDAYQPDAADFILSSRNEEREARRAQRRGDQYYLFDIDEAYLDGLAKVPDGTDLETFVAEYLGR